MHSVGTPALWVVFTAVIVVVLAVDLRASAKSSEPMSKRSALRWTLLWVTLGCAFGGFLYWLAPAETRSESTLEYFSAYLIEYSLSVDNLFVFLLLFHAFRVPPGYQQRVLFWGIFGTVILRGVFIFAGTALLSSVHAFITLFGAFLVYTGIKLLVAGDSEDEGDVSDNRVVRIARKYIRVTDSYDGNKFFTLVDGVRKATPLLLVVVTVEISDLLFAFDSVPGAFGISLDPFIVYTSNIFAILGLRSLFFIISGVLWGLRFLKPALGVVLAFIGLKMCLPFAHWVGDQFGAPLAWLPADVPTGVSLCVVGGLLGLGIVTSLVFPGKKTAQVSSLKDDLDEVITGKHKVPK